MYKICSVIFAITLGLAECCTNPTITSKDFTTQDGTIVTKIACISEFTVQCDSGVPSSLYTYLQGSIVPVSVVSPNTYQVSWVEDIKLASKGYREIPIYDEEGYGALRKVLRAEEDVSSVKPAFIVSLHHPGTYTGPLVKSEFVATMLSLLVAYIAITARSKIVA